MLLRLLPQLSKMLLPQQRLLPQPQPLMLLRLLPQPSKMLLPQQRLLLRLLPQPQPLMLLQLLLRLLRRCSGNGAQSPGC